jgi:hypothetical protein
MDRHRLPLGGRALLPAVLLVLALTVAWAARVPPPLGAALPAPPAVTPAMEQPLDHATPSLTVRPAGHHAQRARRAPPPAAVVGAGLVLALVVTTPRRPAAARARPFRRRPLLQPRAPPLPSS